MLAKTTKYKLDFFQNKAKYVLKHASKETRKQPRKYL